MDAVVDTDWLADTLPRSKNLIVLDATRYLPGESKRADEEFRQAHIPGALFFDLDLFSDPDTDLPVMAPSAGRFARLASGLGISNDASIVVYDQKGLSSAARAWWLFGLFGHDAVAILDGGLPKWRSEERPIEEGLAAGRPAVQFIARFRAERLRGLGDMVGNLSTQAALVLDARPPSRFSGAERETRPDPRSGHIPGSRNLPAARLLNADQTLKSPAQLREVFASVGDVGNGAVITSCGSGISAAVLTLARQIAGLPPGTLYDGSWSEWGADKSLPLHGPEPDPK